MHSMDLITNSLTAAASACHARTKELSVLCERAPLQDVARELDATDPWLGYRHIPPNVLQQWAEASFSFGEDGLADYLRLLLQHYIARYAQRASELRLTEQFITESGKVFLRMLGQCADATLHASPSDDMFLKDLAIARGRMIPCVSHLIYRHSGVPRRAVLTQPLQKLPGLLAFFTRLGGFRPFLENHVHPVMLDDFNPEGRRHCYAMVAELLRMWPDSKGLIGASWYYDPELGVISPNLAYLYEEPAAQGARFIRIASEGPDSGALARSTRRRQLFEMGRYVPNTYLMIWPRAAILSRY